MQRLSAIGLTELIHDLYRAKTSAMRLRRESFLTETVGGLDGGVLAAIPRS
jgi:hypothetical protein